MTDNVLENGKSSWWSTLAARIPTSGGVLSREWGVNQRVEMNLGRKDIQAPHLGSLVRLLQGEGAESSWVCAAEVSPREAACWGPMLVARSLWQELGLGM